MSDNDPLDLEHTPTDQLSSVRDHYLSALLHNVSTLIFLLNSCKADTMDSYDKLQKFLLAYDAVTREMYDQVTLVATVDFELYRRAKQALLDLIAQNAEPNNNP